VAVTEAVPEMAPMVAAALTVAAPAVAKGVTRIEIQVRENLSPPAR